MILKERFLYDFLIIIYFAIFVYSYFLLWIFNNKDLNVIMKSRKAKANAEALSPWRTKLITWYFKLR